MTKPDIWSHGTLIIAEAGVNHNASLERAFEMIAAAKEAGADAIKFQAWRAENLVSRHAGKAEYQITAVGEEGSQLEMLRTLEISDADEMALQAECERVGIRFLCSPFDLPAIDLLVGMKLDAIKVPSGEITNLPYLRKLGAAGQKVILSSGMSTLDEIEAALQILEQAGTPRADVAVLHCNTEYPTPFEDVNLLAMNEIGRRLNVAVGYSDHTPGIAVPIAAAALGAQIVEKHFTLDRNLPGPDHRASLEPDELTAMVCGIREIAAALGTAEKRPSASETKNMPIARKSIVAACGIRAGDTFSEDNLTVKRPGNGVSPMLWDQVIGRRAPRDFDEDDLITLPEN